MKHSQRFAVNILVSICLVFLMLERSLAAQDHPVADGKGFQQNRDYFSQMFFEHIDTATGALILTFTDLVLPGPGGRDLKFQRTYNSKDGKWTFGLAGYPFYVRDPGLPPIGTDADTIEMAFTPIITGPDGALHRTYTSHWIDNTTTGGLLGTLDLVTTDRFWRYARGARQLYLPDGTSCRYEVDPGDALKRRLIACFAPHSLGLEEVSIQWGSPTIVTQNIGGQRREVAIELTADGVPTTLTYMGKTWTYTWGATPRVTPPVGPAWEFTSTQGGPGTMVVKTPHGGQISYVFENQAFPNLDTEEQHDTHSLVVARRIVLDRGATQPLEWIYTYANRTEDGTTTIETPTHTRYVYLHEGDKALIKNRKVQTWQDEQRITLEEESRDYILVPVHKKRFIDGSGWAIAVQSHAVDQRWRC
jgi:hypothetical protein